MPIMLPSPVESVTPDVTHHEGTKSKPSATSSSLPTSTPNTASQTPPPATSPVIQPQQPVTVLDRVVLENRGLTPDDKNRLSNELYECDQFIKQSQAVGVKISNELNKITNDRQSGVIAKNVEEHIKVLRELSESAKGQYSGLVQLQQKWRYFQNQTDYVFGDDPYNRGVAAQM